MNWPRSSLCQSRASSEEAGSPVTDEKSARSAGLSAPAVKQSGTAEDSLSSLKTETEGFFMRRGEFPLEVPSPEKFFRKDHFLLRKRKTTGRKAGCRNGKGLQPERDREKMAEVWRTKRPLPRLTITASPSIMRWWSFPYPSGQGLHVGHPRPYTALDIVARKRRMEGYNVLYPMGWDAFGLPTENYAIKNHIHPKIVTKNNVHRFKTQLQSLGYSFDWDRRSIPPIPTIKMDAVDFPEAVQGGTRLQGRNADQLVYLL